MTSIAFSALSINNAEQFKESVSEPSPNTKLFLTYGRLYAWDDENSPPTPNTTVSSAYEVWKNMIGGKRVTGADMRHVIKRNNWTANTYYNQYDSDNPDLFNENNTFYVLTDEYHVYKCISNAYGNVSTIKPSYVSSGMGTKLADGYVWKYMYSINSSEQLSYLTPEYMLVKTLSSDDGSIQWDVQEDAVEGGIYNIKITNPGSGYSNEANLIVVVTGDGQSWSGYANISNGAIANVTILDPGLNYAEADVRFSGGKGSGSGVTATGRVILSPHKGHGKDAIYELGGSRLIVSVKVKGTENDVLPANNDLRQIAIVKDPLLFASTEIASNTAFYQGQTIVTTGSGNYVPDEFVYQGQSLGLSTYSARVLSWDSSTGILKVVNVTGGTPTAASLIGESSSTTRFVVSVDDADLEPYSGQVLYMDNIKPITRSIDQTENYRIILKF